MSEEKMDKEHIKQRVKELVTEIGNIYCKFVDHKNLFPVEVMQAFVSYTAGTLAALDCSREQKKQIVAHLNFVFTSTFEDGAKAITEFKNKLSQN